MPAISLPRVTKSWGATRAVDDVSFDAAVGTLAVLLGPSGCGKSTTLRLIAGLEALTSGRVTIGDADVTGLPPARRLVDHIVVMAKGGPDNASALLLLYYIYDVGAVWTAFHPAEYSARFVPTAPLTLQNFANAWSAAPFARLSFAGRDALFLLVLVQLMIMPDVLIVENYRTMSRLGLLDTIFAMGLPYMASAFGIFLLRQTFKTVPTELDEAARVEGARPLTVGLQIFSSTDQGVDWSIITAATLLTSGPLLLAFLLFQRQFVQSFMRAGIR